MKRDQQRLLGAAAAAVILAGAGGFGLATFLSRQGADHAEGEEAHGAEEAHGGEAAHEGEEHAGEGHEGEEHAGEEGLVQLTAAQLQATGITVVSPGRGGGSEVRLSGRVEPLIDARAPIGASVSGRVERVHVMTGQTVRAGQAVVTLVSGEAAGLRAEADAAAAAADAARRAYERDRTLGEQGVVARQEVEASRATSLSAEANARAARARVAAAGGPNASGRVSVSAPISGTVTNISVGPGGFVAQGGAVAEITNPSRVELVFNAPPTVAAGVRSGTRLSVQGPNGDFAAVVVGVAADAGGQESGATLIRARPVGAALPPAGSPVTGAIVVGAGAGGGVITVPTEAVQTVEGATVLFVQVPQGFRATPVLAGRQAGGRTEILRGLTGAERVAAANAFLLKAELAKGEAEHGH